MITGIKVAKLSFSTGNKVRSSNLLGFQKRSFLAESQTSGKTTADEIASTNSF